MIVGLPAATSPVPSRRPLDSGNAGNTNKYGAAHRSARERTGKRAQVKQDLGSSP